MTPLQVGPVTLLHTRARGLNDLVLHDLHVLAHNFTGSVKLSLPMLVVEGVYEIPGLWWTTTGHFNLTLTNISADTTISIAVLPDGCFCVYDYQTNMTHGSFSYSTDGLLDDAGLLDFFFDDLFALLLHLTKPTILAFANHQIRRGLTNFLPPNGTADSSSIPSSSLPPSLEPSEPISPHTVMYDNDHLQSHNDHSLSQDELSTGGNLLTFDDHLLTPEELPSPEEQVAALVRFVSYQIEWMIGDPLYLPNITLNVLDIAEVSRYHPLYLPNITLNVLDIAEVSSYHPLYLPNITLNVLDIAEVSSYHLHLVII
ncbi:uncharacterized protein LOC108682234 [Hyalella azteca]|uniref:Uncharacterized protein LOC108682234 n=1 Tax=Hyalella azteca TaxID=294128 RepID=A0A8B7PKZ8_HYAAZ|nr:uncharacterized protein LOC108682234 [Hyalella azteca]